MEREYSVNGRQVRIVKDEETGTLLVSDMDGNFSETVTVDGEELAYRTGDRVYPVAKTGIYNALILAITRAVSQIQTRARDTDLASIDTAMLAATADDFMRGKDPYLR